MTKYQVIYADGSRGMTHAWPQLLMLLQALRSSPRTRGDGLTMRVARVEPVMVWS